MARVFCNSLLLHAITASCLFSRAKITDLREPVILINGIDVAYVIGYGIGMKEYTGHGIEVKPLHCC